MRDKGFRLVVAALGAIAAFSSGALACAGPPMPPREVRTKPTVPYKVFYVPKSALETYCGVGKDGRPPQFACTYPVRKQEYWAVIINRELSHDEVVCSLIYEKAHMPPNYWADPGHERPEFVEQSKEWKRTGRLF